LVGCPGYYPRFTTVIEAYGVADFVLVDGASSFLVA